MAHRSPGEGSITRRKDGRWQGSLQLGGVRKTVYGKTRAEVVTKLKALRAEADKNQRLSDAGKTTLGEYLTAWLEQAEGHLRPTTKQRYEYDIRHAELLKDVKLAKLTSFVLSRFLTRLAKDTSQRTARGVYLTLHKALADAAKWGLLASNPLAFMDCPRYRPGEKRLWTPEDVQLFIQAVVEGQGGHYGDLLLFLLASGCRLGEALGLRWNDIDFKDGTVRIERQLTEVNGKHIEQSPKTKAGIRTITVPGFGLEALRRQRERAASLRVFVTEAGTTPLRSNVRRALHGLCERLGLPRIRVHDLRHLHLSILAMSGVPVKVAQQRAGHSSPTITMAVYQHVLGDGDRQAAEALDRVLRGGGAR